MSEEPRRNKKQSKETQLMYDENRKNKELERAEKFARFLHEYSKCGVEGLACDRAGLRRVTKRDWVKAYPVFAEKLQEIKDRFVDGLEVIAIERAKEKSDGLLMFLLKAQRKEVYGERVEVDVRETKAVELIISESMLTDQEKTLILKQKEELLQLNSPVQQKEVKDGLV